MKLTNNLIIQGINKNSYDEIKDLIENDSSQIDNILTTNNVSWTLQNYDSNFNLLQDEQEFLSPNIIEIIKELKSNGNNNIFILVRPKNEEPQTTENISHYRHIKAYNNDDDKKTKLILSNKKIDNYLLDKSKTKILINLTDKQFLDEYILNLVKYNINLELINLLNDCIHFINVPRNQINCITSNYEEENENKCVITNNTRFVYKEKNEGTLYLLIIKKLEWLNNRIFNLEDDEILINYMDKELKQRIITFMNNLIYDLYKNYNIYDIENNTIKNFSIKK